MCRRWKIFWISTVCSTLAIPVSGATPGSTRLCIKPRRKTKIILCQILSLPWNGRVLRRGGGCTAPVLGNVGSDRDDGIDSTSNSASGGVEATCIGSKSMRAIIGSSRNLLRASMCDEGNVYRKTGAGTHVGGAAQARAWIIHTATTSVTTEYRTSRMRTCWCSVRFSNLFTEQILALLATEFRTPCCTS